MSHSHFNHFTKVGLWVLCSLKMFVPDVDVPSSKLCLARITAVIWFFGTNAAFKRGSSAVDDKLKTMHHWKKFANQKLTLSSVKIQRILLNSHFQLPGEAKVSSRKSFFYLPCTAFWSGPIGCTTLKYFPITASLTLVLALFSIVIH